MRNIRISAIIASEVSTILAVISIYTGGPVGIMLSLILMNSICTYINLKNI